VPLEHGKNGGIVVYVPKEPILEEIAAKIKLGQHFFFDLVQEFTNSTLYVCKFHYLRQANHVPEVVWNQVIW
jgi:hypothetical protein